MKRLINGKVVGVAAPTEGVDIGHEAIAEHVEFLRDCRVAMDEIGDFIQALAGDRERLRVQLADVQRHSRDLMEANNRYLERARVAEAALAVGASEYRRLCKTADRLAISGGQDFVALKKAEAALTAAPTLKSPRRVRHVRVGSTYEVIGEATMRTERPIGDLVRMIVYRSDKDGSLGVQSMKEFHDGRFVAITDVSKLEPDNG